MDCSTRVVGLGISVSSACAGVRDIFVPKLAWALPSTRGTRSKDPGPASPSAASPYLPYVLWFAVTVACMHETCTGGCV